MKNEQIYDGPFGQYVLEIGIILLVSFILGYLLRLLLNDKLKDQLAELELENEVLKKQMAESSSKNGDQLDAKLKQSELKVRDLNDKLSHCIASRVKAESALNTAERKIKTLELEVSHSPDDAGLTSGDMAKPTIVSSVGSTTKDDLTKIEGVGPKIQQLLNEGGIGTFKDIIAKTPQEIRSILMAAGPTYAVHDPTTWSEQSVLADAGKWDELKELQEELKGGKRTR